jgi:cyclopropane fatty-acyl-phospholipid synthase-like methyltransferase
MIDDKFFFDKSVELGFTTTNYQSLVNLHGNGVECLKTMGCKSVYEFGSGLGFFLSACINNNLYDYMGYDINVYEREFAISKGVDPDRYLLPKGKFKVKGKYDAIYSTEVFEHIYDEELKLILPELSKACTKYFYFTSTPNRTTPEWDAEWGHINIKQKEEWIELFKKYGFDYLQDVTDVTSWGLLFVKNDSHGKR